MSRGLVVPISVEALCVGRATPTLPGFLGPTADFSSLPIWDDRVGLWRGKPFIADSVVNFPNPSPEHGVHLHWALPDALTRGETGEDGRMKFPAVPNRWLVARLRRPRDTDARPGARAWVVESDYLGMEGEGSISIPAGSAEAKQFFRFLGRATELQQWREASAPTQGFRGLYGTPLTAVGYGEPTFAAYYPNCRNVFGFHDSVDDLADFDPARDTLSYLVVGWFSELALDPLRGGDVAGDDNRLRWRFGDGLPDHALCSGLLQNVQWDPAGGGTATAGAPLEIAIGDSNMECISALLANRRELIDDRDAEFLLNAAQLGMLAAWRGPDHLAELEEAIHTGAFAATPGGVQWSIGPADGAPPVATEATMEPPVELSDALGSKLAELNTLQQTYDRSSDELDSLRRALFLDWVRYVSLLHGEADEALKGSAPELAERDARDALINDLRDALETRCDDIAARAADLAAPAPEGTAGGRLARAVAELDAAVKSECKGRLVLRKGPGVRFWSPAEPVILLAGEDARPPLRYGGDNARTETKDGLPCRLVDTVTTGLKPRDAGRPIVRAVDRAPQLPLAALPYADEIAALIGEATLLDATQKDGAPKDFTLIGTPPAAPGLTAWQGNPWLPLFLKWQVEYHSAVAPNGDGADFAPDTVVAQYALDADRIDLVHRGAAPVRAQLIEGVSLLAQNAFLKLGQALGDLAQGAPDAALTATVEALANTPMLSQVLSGFNEALLTKRQALQLDVVDPFDRRSRLPGSVRAAVAGNTETGPLPLEAFHPIRAGFLKLNALSLVDVFGQIRPIDLSKARLSRSNALRVEGPGMGAGGFVHLPPRIVQPARLNFRLLSAQEDGAEAGAHSAGTPVCGWLLVDNLDAGLMVYAADGATLGSLRLVGGGTRVLWSPAPVPGQPAGETDRLEETLHSIDEGVADRHLADFLKGILAHPDGGRHFERLLHAVDRALETIVPDGANPDLSLAVLVGRPLALVRAALSLEVRGGPAFATGWRSLRRELDSGARATRGLADVRFEVKLGDLRQISDGLVGYFKTGSNGSQDYGRFFALAADADANGVAPAAAGPVSVSLSAGQQVLTLLMDPHSAVHASSGVLPVKSIELPASCYAQPLARMQVSFPCNPVLAPAGGPTLPLPAVPGFDWRWLQAGPQGWRASPEAAGPGDKALFGYSPLRVIEGWLQLAPVAPDQALPSAPSANTQPANPPPPRGASR